VAVSVGVVPEGGTGGVGVGIGVVEVVVVVVGVIIGSIVLMSLDLACQAPRSRLDLSPIQWGSEYCYKAANWVDRELFCRE